MPDLYIIKLGGSVITEKEVNRLEAKRETIARIASEINRALKENGFQLIIVHGAGPFGHTNVVEYNINNGVFSKRQGEGLKKTIKDCNFLNSVVVEKMKKNEIDAIAFDPNKIVVQKSKKIVVFETKGIEKALKESKVPVLYGQMVPDKKLNASVLSGDTIIAFLAKKFKPKKVLVGTDVSGIFTTDPKKDKRAKRIERIDKNNFGSVFRRVGGASTVDVTQGMKGKLLRLKEQLHGAIAVIFDANEKNSFYKTLTGKKIKGTEIVL